MARESQGKRKATTREYDPQERYNYLQELLHEFQTSQSKGRLAIFSPLSIKI